MTGKGYYDKISAEVTEKNIILNRKTQIMPYVNDMMTYLAACDIAVSRAGAIAVTELMVCGKPAILIPSPHVAGNHQLFNAKALVDKGGAVLIEEKDLDFEKFAETIMHMKENQEILIEMSKATTHALKENPVEIIYNNLKLS
jgi:UDP-N-acetylglucosamine--N-acetylmuramyl-(pentapeptide) pyrophosphoryl-undecaprenol N-acetylglucosamine transferase